MSAHACGGTRLNTVATGVLFVASGLALWAGARGWYSMREAWPYWPLGFIFPAVHHLTAPPPERSVGAGLIWLAAMAALIAMNLGYLHLRVRDVVPAVLVVVGLRLLLKARSGDGRAS